MDQSIAQRLWIDLTLKGRQDWQGDDASFKAHSFCYLLVTWACFDILFLQVQVDSYTVIFSPVFKCCGTIQILEWVIDLKSTLRNLAFVYCIKLMNNQHYLTDFWLLCKSKCFKYMPASYTFSVLIKLNDAKINPSICSKGFGSCWAPSYEKSKEKVREKKM